MRAAPALRRRQCSPVVIRPGSNPYVRKPFRSSDARCDADLMSLRVCQPPADLSMHIPRARTVSRDRCATTRNVETRGWRQHVPGPIKGVDTSRLETRGSGVGPCNAVRMLPLERRHRAYPAGRRDAGSGGLPCPSAGSILRLKPMLGHGIIGAGRGPEIKNRRGRHDALRSLTKSLLRAASVH